MVCPIVKKITAGIIMGAMSCATMAAVPQTSSPLAPAELEQTWQYDFVAKATGESYRIQVFVPRKPPPPAGYPVLCLLDGNLLFGTFAGAMQYRSNAGELEPAVIVGIASGSGSGGADRDLDFTPGPRTAFEDKITVDGSPDDPFGGAEAFLRVIQSEIKPRVATMVYVDRKREMLFGWSLGGLFVLHTALAHTGAFSSYAVLSPSLWYGGGATFKELPMFKRTLARLHEKPRIFIGVGSREGDAREFGTDEATLKRWGPEMRYARMVRNAVAMGDLLKPVYRTDASNLVSKVFPGDTHQSIPWTATTPVLNFLLGTPVTRSE